MKGCRDFIDVIANLPPNFSGLVVGSGPDEDSLRQQVARAALDHRVHFAGLLLLAAFTFVHVVMVLLHPRTLWDMVTGGGKR